MANYNNPLLLSLTLSVLFLFHSCAAQLELPQHQFWQNLQQQQQHRLRAKTQCRIQQLNAREPSYRSESEAGITEFWDANSEEFECAGVEFVRHVIQPKGLLLPYYTNAPQLIYIIQGEIWIRFSINNFSSGIQGTVIPGCAETYETESRSSEREGEEGSRTRRPDRHQKLRRFRRGDILALPQGITHWAYNDGDTPIISVSLLDVANDNNQLDLKFRKFFLAGNPRGSQSQGERGREQRQRGEGRRGEEEEQEQEKSNIFNGFDEELLAETFNIDRDIIRRLQGREDNRGTIVRAERLRLVLPEYGREEQEREREQERGRGGGYNGLEETFCSLKIRENIDHPTRADVYNPRGGRISTLNSQAFPILSYLRLSAARGILYKNAIMAPHWSINSHSAIYVTKGSARIQVVGNQGKSVFDGEVNEGQLLIVPQNFVALKRASEQGFEWIAFKTNDNAMSSQLAGRLSAIRAMPEEVLMNAYGVSRQDARNLKYSREEATLFSPGSTSGRSV
ncbi:hypothetical protein BUALT_Bualt14G0116300 [Buddleja alternifolia]|uniref:Cupin type-1 domain-containing protein n=1 Tax=Buddleja alternifolia TaxID=168488 RepID=A0AAV6WU26_9LAMI|nr:hypothetical protein BUALT_Bualt14G0115300 [Buddleja alternifolia]KAG8370433.1 hypothetical protein BUALT_Bualt14G0116300 [Buddleja alternifolia]